jgi:hypothetical protein
MTHAGVTLEVMFFGPMYDPRIEVGGLPGVVITFAIAFVLWVIGWIWINRITHPEDYREANDRSWRSRDRLDLSAFRLQLARRARQTATVRPFAKPFGPTRSWLITRTIMRISDGALLVAIWLMVSAWTGADETFSDALPSVAGPPARIIIAAVACSGIVVGWIWIRRIARGEPEPESNDRFWRSRR